MNSNNDNEVYNGLKPNSEVTPKELFNAVKGHLKKEIESAEKRSTYYQTILKLMKKARLTGQKTLARKLTYHMYCVETQEKIKDYGVDTYVYKEDLKEYVDKVSDKVVKIARIEDFPREIPDEIVEKIEKLNGIFDALYVVYTDYTLEASEEVQSKYVEKDPILFGTLENGILDDFDGRMYYIADWEDEFCDLTLDKLITEYKETTGNTINYSLEKSEIDEIKHASKLYNKELERKMDSSRIGFNG